MKRISTLLTFVCLFTLAQSVSAQYSQNFDNASEVASFRSNCWTLKDFAYSSTDLSTGTGSLATAMSDSAYFTTPLMNKPTGGDVTITLTYLVGQEKTGINALKLNLIDINGNAINVKKLNAGVSDGKRIISYTLQSNKVPAVFNIQVVSLNIAVTIDDFSTNASLTPDGCTAGALIPMPVKLMSFAGNAANNHAQLRWSVADNETGEHFEVLRSVDGKHFTEAGVVFTNNKVGAQSYTYSDQKELDAISYYQLKIVNKDESISYSNVIILKSATDKASTGLTILQNPVGSTLTFTYTAGTTNQGQVSIYNMLGAKVYGSRLNSQQGANSVSLNLDSHMASGTYILEVVNGAERAVTRMLKK